MQSTLHKPKYEHSTTQNVPQIDTSAGLIHSGQQSSLHSQTVTWSACDNTTHILLPHPLPHPPWQPKSSCPSKYEAEHGPMVHKEGGGPASECKIEKNAIQYGRIDATRGAFSHSACTVRAQRRHSARTTPIITVIIQVTTLKTTHLRNHAQSIQNSKIQTSDACHGSQGPKFCPLWGRFRTARAQRQLLW